MTAAPSDGCVRTAREKEWTKFLKSMMPILTPERSPEDLARTTWPCELYSSGNPAERWERTETVRFAGSHVVHHMAISFPGIDT